MGELVPVFGMITGIAIPLAVFFWQYLEGKERRETILEISKTIDDPDKLDELLKMLDERKEEPTDYRRGGVITTFVGLGIYALGTFAFGDFVVYEAAAGSRTTLGLGFSFSGGCLLKYFLFLWAVCSLALLRQLVSASEAIKTLSN